VNTPVYAGKNEHNISQKTLNIVGLTAEQFSNILSMIGGAEQSNIRWWEAVDKTRIYGYCENINDGRGVTMGVAGFVSMWGLAHKIVKDAGGGSFDVSKCRPGRPTKCSFCDWIRNNALNTVFINAQWDAYAKEFMSLVTKYIPPQFKNNALIIGIVLDTAINAGEFSEGNAWGVKDIAQAATRATGGRDATSWAISFLDTRYAHFTSGNDETMRAGRINAWKKLVADNKWTMEDIDVCKYAFCYGKCIGC
jgi:chitosanase